MNNIKWNILILLNIFSLLLSFRLSGKTYDIFSPDRRIKVKILINENISYSVYFDSATVILPSAISLTVNDGNILGYRPKVLNSKLETVNRIISPVVPEKRKFIIDHYNELSLDFSGKYGLIFRVYNDGVAYRFMTKFDNKINIISEQAVFNFAKNHYIYFPTEEGFITHCERHYEYLPLNKITFEKMSSLPVLIDNKDGLKVAITESDLDDYPGMYLTGSDSGSFSLYGKFPAYPIKQKQKGDRTLLVTKRADYIAITEGNRVYPWRIIVIAADDAGLIETDIVYRLAKPLQLKDTSWIKPGKVAWDWWNANNIYGVDFKAGINTKTYKYYIDFAAENNLEYIILDEGWSDTRDLFKINPDLDMEELLAYANEKHVGVILWVVWLTLDRQLHKALDAFEEWGIKGIKVDFMQRDDQKLVNFYHKIVKEAAKRKMIVDFHGSYKPTGLRRAFPNLLTREGILGLEHNKWCEKVTPEHDVTVPFIRMLAGPMDFTPGAMINAQKKNFRPIYDRPMSQGTRIHQLAMYVVYESPLQMLADCPSNYLKEPEIMSFLSKVPTVWDETKVIAAKVADYVVIARKCNEEWYVGAMTDWTPREFDIKLSFLEKGNYIADIYSDGVNAHRYAADYKKVRMKVTQNDRLKIKLAPGGGWVARMFYKN